MSSSSHPLPLFAFSLQLSDVQGAGGFRFERRAREVMSEWFVAHPGGHAHIEAGEAVAMMGSEAQDPAAAAAGTGGGGGAGGGGGEMGAEGQLMGGGPQEVDPYGALAGQAAYHRHIKVAWVDARVSRAEAVAVRYAPSSGLLGRSSTRALAVSALLIVLLCHVP